MSRQTGCATERVAFDELEDRDPYLLTEACDRARERPEARGWRARWFERVSAELLRDPHGDPAWSRRAFDAIATVLGDDSRLRDRAWVRRLLEIYLRWDRHSVRKLFATTIGRAAAEPLQAIMQDPEEPGAIRIAAASCSMALGWRERRAGFAYVLDHLGAEDAGMRREAAAVIVHFGKWELLRARAAVARAAFAALAGPRGDAAQTVIRHGLTHPRTASYVEGEVVRVLADQQAPIALRRALAKCLTVPRPRAVDPLAVGDVLDAVLATSDDPVMQRNALLAFSQLRRQYESTPTVSATQPFADAAAAHAWWQGVRAGR